MKNIYDPCSLCDNYPHNCSNMCGDKLKYKNEADGDTPIIKKQRKKRVFDNNYNKNGIRRS